MTKKLLGLVTVMVLTIAACGGSTSDPDSANPDEQKATTMIAQDEPADEPESSQDEPADEPESSPAESGDYAIVTIGSDVYRFTDADVCDVSSDSYLVSFNSGEDELLLGEGVGDRISLQLWIDGAQWGNPSPLQKPEVSDGLLTWEVTLVSSKTAALEQSSIEVHC